MPGLSSGGALRRAPAAAAASIRGFGRVASRRSRIVCSSSATLACGDPVGRRSAPAPCGIRRGPRRADPSSRARAPSRCAGARLLPARAQVDLVFRVVGILLHRLGVVRDGGVPVGDAAPRPAPCGRRFDAAHPPASKASRTTPASLCLMSLPVSHCPAHRNRPAARAVGIFHHDRLHADLDDAVPAEQLSRLPSRRTTSRPSEKIAILPGRPSNMPMNFSGIGGGGGGGGGGSTRLRDRRRRAGTCRRRAARAAAAASVESERIPPAGPRLRRRLLRARPAARAGQLGIDRPGRARGLRCCSLARLDGAGARRWPPATADMTTSATTAAPSASAASGRGRAAEAPVSRHCPTGNTWRSSSFIVRRALCAGRRWRGRADVLEDDELRRGLERVDELPHVAVVAGQRVGRRRASRACCPSRCLTMLVPCSRRTFACCASCDRRRVRDASRDARVWPAARPVELAAAPSPPAPCPCTVALATLHPAARGVQRSRCTCASCSALAT